MNNKFPCYVFEPVSGSKWKKKMKTPARENNILATPGRKSQLHYYLNIRWTWTITTDMPNLIRKSLNPTQRTGKRIKLGAEGVVFPSEEYTNWFSSCWSILKTYTQVLVVQMSRLYLEIYT